MKIFTKSVLVAIAMMTGVTTVSAQSWNEDTDNWVELTSDMWFQWADETPVLDPNEPSCSKNAVQGAASTPAWNVGSEVGAGSCVLGAENVTYNLYADISEYDYLIIFGAGGPGMRIMCNRIHHEGAWKNLVVGFNADDPHWDATLECLAINLNEIKNMKLEVNCRKQPDPNDPEKQIDIPNTNANTVEEAAGWIRGAERVDDFVHLHCFKNAWGGNFPVTVSSAYLWKAGGASGIKTIKNEVAGDGAYYNLQGQRVDNPTKGLFIHNGKKVILK